MNIALDYDHTYTVDPEFWYEFMTNARDRGYNIFIVTYRDERYDTTEGLEFLIEDDFEVYFTRGVAKKWWMNQFAPEEHKNVCVWIDDKPEAILNNSVIDNKGLEEWRQTRVA